MADQSIGDAVTEVATKWGPLAGLLAGLVVTRAGRISDGIGSIWNAYADRVRAHTEELRGRTRRRDLESAARAARDNADAELAREAIRLRREEALDSAVRQPALLDNVGGSRARAARRTGS